MVKMDKAGQHGAVQHYLKYQSEIRYNVCLCSVIWQMIGALHMGDGGIRGT